MVILIQHDDLTWQQIIDRELNEDEISAIEDGMLEAIRYEGNRFQNGIARDGKMTWENVEEIS